MASYMFCVNKCKHHTTIKVHLTRQLNFRIILFAWHNVNTRTFSCLIVCVGGEHNERWPSLIDTRRRRHDETNSGRTKRRTSAFRGRGRHTWQSTQWTFWLPSPFAASHQHKAFAQGSQRELAFYHHHWRVHHGRVGIVLATCKRNTLWYMSKYYNHFIIKNWHIIL